MSVITEPSDKVRVLFISASPKNLVELAEDKEYKAIETELLQKGALRDRFTLRRCASASRLEIDHCVEEFQPHIIHFTAHGEVDGLFVVDGPGVADQLDIDTLEHFVSGSKPLKIVLLNACSSATLADELQTRLPALAVIGTTHAVEDRDAVAFSRGFYASLARGRRLARAFRAGSAAIPHSNNSNRIFRHWGPGNFKVDTHQRTRFLQFLRMPWLRRLALVSAVGLAAFLLATRAPVLKSPTSQVGEWRPKVRILVDPQSQRALARADLEYLRLALGLKRVRLDPATGMPQPRKDPIDQLEQTFHKVLSKQLPMFEFTRDADADVTAALVVAIDPETSATCGVVDNDGFTIEAHIEVNDGERLRNHFALCMAIPDAALANRSNRNLVAENLRRRLGENILRSRQGGLAGFSEIPFHADYKVAPWRREVLTSRLLADTKFGKKYEQFAKGHVRMSVKDEEGARQTFLLCNHQRISGPLIPLRVVDDFRSCDDIPWMLWPRRTRGESIYLDAWTPLPWSD